MRTPRPGGLLARNQRPRLSQSPVRAVATAGDDAIAWAESIGWDPLEGRGFYVLDEWQKFCIRGILSEDAEARLCALTALLLVPRQNGKNVVLEVVELYAFFVLELRYILHSAHLAETSADHMQRLWDAIESDEALSSRCRRVVANGKERIYSLPEPGKPSRVIRFRTRSKKIGRGGSPQMAVFDEALHLTDRQQQGMLPSLSAQSARPDKPILIYASSAPVEAEEAEVLLRIRAAILAGEMPDAWFAEWSCEVPEGDWDEGLRQLIADRDNWVEANPGMPERISPDWVDAVERPSMSPEAFAIERLGVIIDVGRAAAGPMPGWYDLADGTAEIVSNRAWALSVSPVENGPQASAFGIAGRTADGRLLVSIIGREPAGLWHAKGTAWVVAAAVQIQSKLGLPLRVHSEGPEGAFIKPLVEAGVEVEEISSGEVARSTGLLIAAANGDDDGEPPSLVHLGQPSLDKAVRGAVLRSGASGAVSWSQRKSSVEITPLQAVTVAAGGVPEPSDEFFAY